MRFIKLFLILMIFVSCNLDKNEGKALLLINNSPSTVYFYTSINYPAHHFPDTLLPSNRPIGLQPIGANGRSGKFTDPDWNEIYSQLLDYKFTMYFLSKDLVDRSEWDEIRDDYSILELFDITFEELEASDYTITFSQD